jgi:MFS transporter, OFA family, oxalate/formate antiporter
VSQIHIQDLPSSPQTAWVNRSPLFYGWVILFAGTVGMVMTSPGQTFAVSILIDPMLDQLQISRTLLSGLYTAATLTGSLALPWLGRQIDARGPRRMALVISVAFGLACLFMGSVSNAFMLGVGFVGIRMFGQGGLSLVSQNVINQWWVRRRGFMLGISGVFMSLIGMAGFPLLIYALMEIFSWRQTFFILGGLVLAVMLPVAYFLFRNQPESYGLQPDGAQSQSVELSSYQPAANEENWTLAEAIRTPVFWVVGAALASGSMLSTGLFFHIVSIFADSGLDTGLAAAIFVPVALTTALVNLSSGILVDRTPVRYVLFAALLL